MTFDLVLPDELGNELTEAARDCRCTALEFACEAVSSVLASRRLPRMWARGPAHGAFTSGYRKVEPEDAAEAGLVTHRVLSPSDMLEML